MAQSDSTHSGGDRGENVVGLNSDLGSGAGGIGGKDGSAAAPTSTSSTGSSSDLGGGTTGPGGGTMAT